MFTVCITGHRPSKLFGYDIHSSLYDTLRTEISKRLVALCDKFQEICCISGCALGTDTIFIEECQKLVDAGYKIHIKLAIPCRNHDKCWSLDDRQRFKEMVTKYDHHYVVNGPYITTCLQLRNRYMVDNSDLVLAVWDGSPSGTGNCVKYAQFRGKRVRRVPYMPQ